jgi:DNA polymerase-3 subunit delta'
MESLNWEIFGNDWAVNLLKTHARTEKLRHAYLFVGPEGIGRRTLSIRFAQALNCRQSPSPGEFCGTCRDCKQFETMQHPDLSILLPEEGHRDILIDQVRALQHSLALAPYMAKYRIALMPNFQRATTEASNALLKTLEEPSDKVVLLLTAHSQESLLPTIVSRCEVVRLRPASVKATQMFLQSSKQISEEEAQLLAHLSSGRIGAALRYAEDPDRLLERRENLESLLKLLTANRTERFKIADALTKPRDKARENISTLLPIWLSFWRDVFIKASGADIEYVNIDLISQIEAASAKLNIQKARQLVVGHEEAIRQLDLYANVQLLLENLMLQWPYLSTSSFAE